MMAKAAEVLAPLVRDAAGLAGAGLIAYGASLVYEPAGYIVGGMMLLVGALLSARRSAA